MHDLRNDLATISEKNEDMTKSDLPGQFTTQQTQTLAKAISFDAFLSVEIDPDIMEGVSDQVGKIIETIKSLYKYKSDRINRKDRKNSYKVIRMVVKIKKHLPKIFRKLKRRIGDLVEILICEHMDYCANRLKIQINNLIKESREDSESIILNLLRDVRQSEFPEILERLKCSFFELVERIEYETASFQSTKKQPIMLLAICDKDIDDKSAIQPGDLEINPCTMIAIANIGKKQNSNHVQQIGNDNLKSSVMKAKDRHDMQFINERKKERSLFGNVKISPPVSFPQRPYQDQDLTNRVGRFTKLALRAISEDPESYMDQKYTLVVLQQIDDGKSLVAHLFNIEKNHTAYHVV